MDDHLDPAVLAIALALAPFGERATELVADVLAHAGLCDALEAVQEAVQLLDELGDAVGHRRLRSGLDLYRCADCALAQIDDIEVRCSKGYALTFAPPFGPDDVSWGWRRANGFVCRDFADEVQDG